MTSFKKYTSLENSYQKKFIENVMLETHDKDLQWIVTEKVHGANFSVHILKDGTIKLAKRSGFIGNGEIYDNFYGIETSGLTPDLIKKSKDLYNSIQMLNDGEPYDLVLYGELFGGKYDHPHISIDNKSKTVQKDVNYSPNHQFIIFDIMIDGDFLNYEDYINFVKEIHEEFKFDYVEPIAIYDSLQDALEHECEFESEIYKQYGLPKIEENYAEGIVIKPSENIYLFNNSRVVIKKKSKAFSEKRARPKKVVEPLPDNLLELVNKANEYITDNRLSNVCSHEGIDPENIEGKEIGKVIGLFNKDVIEDFIKDTPEFNDLDKGDRKKITKAINTHSAKYIKNKIFGYV